MFVGYMLKYPTKGSDFKTKENLVFHLELANRIFGTSIIWPDTTFMEVHSLILRIIVQIVWPHRELLEVYSND